MNNESQAPLILKHAAAVVTCDANLGVQRDVDIVIQNGRFQRITAADDSTSAYDEHAEIIDARHWIIYPGLVNTHHHFFQAFVRNRAEYVWPGDVLAWIERIYPEFARLTEPCFFHTAAVCMADLIKHGCTTAFDHQYCFPKHAGSYLVDRQIEAAQMLGMRFVVGRGTNTLSISEGGNVPDPLVESLRTYLQDVERLVDDYHDAADGSMLQIVPSPCQPMNCSAATFTESMALAEQHDLALHTHLGEGESESMLARHGVRSLAWAEQIGFVGPRVWVAHAWDLQHAEIDRLKQLDVGVSHCPAPMNLVGDGITDVEGMLAAGVRVGLGVDGCASNDSSNLAEAIRQAYLAQCGVVRNRQLAAPEPQRYLEAATVGGASLLRRDDIGRIAPGYCADLFAIDTNRMEYVGALQHPQNLPAKLGFSHCVDMTMIQGRVVWCDGEFPGLDESALVREATACLQATLG